MNIVKKSLSKRAQAVIELAVFGGILIFIIGAIVRQGLSSSYQQSTTLKAMRMAMLQSLKMSEREIPARNSSSVLILEDRFSVDFNKFHELNRSPFIAQGSGIFSNLLFYPIDAEDLRGAGYGLPIFDMYINGQHFPLTTAGFVVHELCPDTNEVYTYAYTDLSKFTNASAANFAGGCGTGDHYRVRSLKAHEFNDETNRWQFFRTVPRTKDIQRFLFNVDGGNLDLNEQFDINRNGVFSDDPTGPVPSVDDQGELLPPTQAELDAMRRSQRGCMAYKWSAVDGTNDNIPIGDQYPTWDVDGDFSDESIYQIAHRGRVTLVLALDPQEGDINPGAELEKTLLELRTNRAGDVTFDPGRINQFEYVLKERIPGVQQDQDIFTFTFAKPDDLAGDPNLRPGTFLIVQEGKLYNPENGEFVRSANRRDQIDMIMRILQLSRDTGRFCKNGIVKTWADGFPGERNPVEQCNECFSVDGVKRTCFDQNTNILYVRSRMKELRGRKWITDATPRPERESALRGPRQ